MNDPRLPSTPSPPQTDNVVESSQPGGEVIERQPVIVPYAVDQATLDGPPPSSGESVPRHVIGGYVVLKKIGEGGMGSVYLAEDPKLGRRVAIKTMKPALAADKANRDRFEREARAAAAVEHDNIVPIWGVGEAVDGSAVHRNAVPPGRDARGAAQAAVGRGAERAPQGGPRGGRRAGRGARQGAHPPGHQAGQHLARRRPRVDRSRAANPPVQDPRLRPGAVRGRGRRAS